MRAEVLNEAIMTNSGKIENLFGRVNKLEKTLNEINEKLSQLVNIKEELNYKSPFIRNPNKKIRAEDFKPLYEKLGFDRWYKEIILPHKEAVENYSDENERIIHDNWEDDASIRDRYARIANMLAYFDIDRIARNIANVNVSTIRNSDKITTYKVDDTDPNSIRDGLYEDVKSCIEAYFNSDEVNDERSYKEFQSGRIHLLSIRCFDKEDGNYIKERLFWTNEDIDEDVYDND